MCSCPSRTDEPYDGEGYNQNPNYLAADLTTNQDLNGIANAREIRSRDARTIASSSQALEDGIDIASNDPPAHANWKPGDGRSANAPAPSIGRPDGAERGDDRKVVTIQDVSASFRTSSLPSGGSSMNRDLSRLARLKKVLVTYGKFVGPGFMISVAYS